MISIAAIPPTKLRKKVGPKKVPPSIDPITTRKKVTITASLNPKKTNATNVMMFARPSFIKGLGKVEVLQDDVK